MNEDQFFEDKYHIGKSFLFAILIIGIMGSISFLFAHEPKKPKDIPPTQYFITEPQNIKDTLRLAIPYYNGRILDSLHLVIPPKY